MDREDRYRREGESLGPNTRIDAEAIVRERAGWWQDEGDERVYLFNAAGMAKRWPASTSSGRWILCRKPERYHRRTPATEILPMSVALWELSSAPPEHVTKDLMSRLMDQELRELFDAPLPIPMAADVLHALVEAPPVSSFTQSFLYSYYLIIRELYTADSPDWAVGGARASPSGGMVSAYMTRRCVQAVLSFVRALENTGTFIAEVGAIHKKAKRFRKMEDEFPELKEWVLAEGTRLMRALHTMTQTSFRRLVLQPPELTVPDIITLATIETYVEGVASRLKEAATNVPTYAQEVLDLAPGDPEAQGILRAVVARYGLIAGAALERAEALRRQEEAGRRRFRLQEPTESRCECFYARRRSYCRCDVCR